MLKPYFQILRPVNVLIAGISVMIAAVITAGSMPVPWTPVFLAALSAALICAGGNVINDYFDVAIDRINKPHRPLPSGALSVRQAKIIWIVFSLSGIAVSLGINGACVAVAGFSTVMLYFYSSHLKRTPLWGNLAVSLLTALAFFYGGLAIGKTEATFFPAAFSFLFHLGREILKDLEDRDGDAKLGARTLPIVYGVRAAQITITVIFLLLAGLTVWPFAVRYYSPVYFSIVAVGIYPVVGFTLISVWKNFSPKNLNRLSNLLKLDMLIGLTAIYFG